MLLLHCRSNDQSLFNNCTSLHPFLYFSFSLFFPSFVILCFFLGTSSNWRWNWSLYFIDVLELSKWKVHFDNKCTVIFILLVFFFFFSSPLCWFCLLIYIISISCDTVIGMADKVLVFWPIHSIPCDEVIELLHFLFTFYTVICHCIAETLFCVCNFWFSL